MKQLHYSALMQTKSLENALILYFRDSENFERYNSINPSTTIKIMTSIFPKLGHLQHLITMFSSDHLSGLSIQVAYEIEMVMKDINNIIKDLEDVFYFGFELVLIKDQFLELSLKVEEIIGEYVH